MQDVHSGSGVGADVLQAFGQGSGASSTNSLDDSTSVVEEALNRVAQRSLLGRYRVEAFEKG